MHTCPFHSTCTMVNEKIHDPILTHVLEKYFCAGSYANCNQYQLHTPKPVPQTHSPTELLQNKSTTRFTRQSLSSYES